MEQINDIILAKQTFISASRERERKRKVLIHVKLSSTLDYCHSYTKATQVEIAQTNILETFFYKTTFAEDISHVAIP